jgi:hypothetical protein
MPALPQRFRYKLAAAMTELGEFGLMRGDFDQGAGPGAFQPCYEHPWCTKSHTLPKLLRPRAIGDLFGDDGVPHRHDLMDQVPMQTLAVGGEPALAGGFASPRGEVPLAVFPPQALLSPLLDAPPLVIVLRVVGTPPESFKDPV